MLVFLAQLDKLEALAQLDKLEKTAELEDGGKRLQNGQRHTGRGPGGWAKSYRTGGGMQDSERRSWRERRDRRVRRVRRDRIPGDRTQKGYRTATSAYRTGRALQDAGLQDGDKR